MSAGWALWRSLPRALPYLKPYWRLGVLSGVLTVASAVVALAVPWPLAAMLDAISGNEAGSDFIFFGETDRYTILAIAVAAGFVITVGGHGLNVVNTYVDSKLEQNMILDLRSDLFQHCQKLSLTFHDGRRTGEMMSRINDQASALGAIIMAFPPIAQSVLTLVGMITIAMFIDWEITLISMSVIPFLYYSLGLYGTRIVPRLRHVQSLEWQSLSIVNEAMSMLRVIVSFGREPFEHRKFREQGQTAVNARVSLTIRQTGFALVVTALTAIGTALVFYFGFRAVFDGRISVGGLVILLSYIAAAYAPLEAISASVGSLHEQFVALNSSLELLQTEPEVKEDPHPFDLEKFQELLRAHGAVTFAGVHFAYQSRASTLTDVSFHIEPGQRVAVVGPTGAGKTTLVSLLVRFYDPQRGQIRIDGIDIRRLRLHTLRSQISLVLQEPLLFSGTVADNIRYGRLEAGMREVVEAAKAANAHEFIDSLPKGYDTVLGERGAQLSGGERQRLAVARAFVKDAPILILDEPTSSIDSRTEAVILDALERLVVGRTSLMVAHRLSTIRHADTILVVNGGRIVESGTHTELLERDGLYRELHEAQVLETPAEDTPPQSPILAHLARALEEPSDVVLERVRRGLGRSAGSGNGFEGSDGSNGTDGWTQRP